MGISEAAGEGDRLRREVVAEALASVRASGLEPSPEGLRRFEAVAERRMTVTEALAETLAPYRG
jgi:hypothetical protein